MSDLDLDAIRRQIDRASDELGALCVGSRRWSMRIPVDLERDSDIVFSNALVAADKLLAEVDRLQRDVDSLARRCAVRFEEAQVLRTEILQLRDERDQLLAEVGE